MDQFTLAVDLGGTKVDAALVSNGTIDPASRHRRPTGAGSSADVLAAAVRDAVRGALGAVGPRASVSQVGIATAGPIDSVEGTTTPVNLQAWKGFGLRELVTSEVRAAFPDANVGFGLDGTAIALAEHRYGSGRGVANFMSMVVSTGIGGGIISNGMMLRGATGNAGHIGQTYVSGFGGSSDVWLTAEDVASGPASIAWAQSQGWKGSTGQDLARDYAAGPESPGHELAVAAVERSAAAVGQAIAAASALLNIELVAIGGGFSRVTDAYPDLVQQAIRRHPLEYVRATRVIASVLGDDGPLLGAALLGATPQADS